MNIKDLTKHYDITDPKNKKIIYFCIGILIVLNMIIQIENINNLIILTISIILNIMLISKMQYKNRLIIYVFMGSFFIKSIYAFFMLSTSNYPFVDSLTYLHHLQVMKRDNGIESFNAVYQVAQSLHVGYHYFIYIIDMIFKHRYALYMSNILMFQSASVLFLNYMDDKKFKDIIINIVIVFMLLSFNMVIFTASILKDSLVLFTVILSLYLYNRHRYHGGRINIILMVLSLIALLLTRIYTCVAIVIALLIDYAINSDIVYNKISNLKLNKQNIIISILLISISFVIVRFTGLWMYVNAILNSMKSAFSDIPDLIIGTIKEIVRTFISPLPWNVLDSLDVYTITAIDSTITMLFIFTLGMLIIKFIKYKGIRKLTLIYIIPIIIQASILGITYDTGSVRQRIGVFLFIPLLYCIGYFYNDKSIDKGIYRN